MNQIVSVLDVDWLRPHSTVIVNLIQ
uniref:Uncharacterized protein n=1 Tax=Anguilla anguilla TaxID=7936 RepID=A0A0E9QIX2_ANGAN